MRDLIEYFIPTFILLAIIFAAFVFVANLWDRHRCDAYSETTGRETKYIHFDGCYINTSEEWLTKKEYLAVLVAREGLKSQFK